MTEVFLRRCKALLDTSELTFKEGLICCPSMKDVDLHKYSQLQGHIQTLRNIVEIKEFLRDEIEELSDEREDTRT